MNSRHEALRLLLKERSQYTKHGRPFAHLQSLQLAVRREAECVSGSFPFAGEQVGAPSPACPEQTGEA